MFEVNYDRVAAEQLALTIGEGFLERPLSITGSDFVVSTDDDDRVLGLDTLVINGRFFKVGLMK